MPDSTEEVYISLTRQELALLTQEVGRSVTRWHVLSVTRFELMRLYGKLKRACYTIKTLSQAYKEGK